MAMRLASFSSSRCLKVKRTTILLICGLTTSCYLLLVFKTSHLKGSRVMPWLRCTDLGFITAIGVGDLLGLGHRWQLFSIGSRTTLKILNLFSLCSVLVVASGCGWLNIFDLSEELSPLEGEPPRHMLPLHTQVRGKIIKLYPVSQRVPANVKDLILCDVTGKGVIELVVSLTDRVVRTYRCEKVDLPYKPHTRSGVTWL